MSDNYIFHDLRRLHPLTIVYKLFNSAPGIIIPLYFAMTNKSTSDLIYYLIIMLLLLVSIPVALLSYFNFFFKITNNELVIRQGIFAKKNRNIPIRRIQNIDIQQNVLHKILGIAKVIVETAGDKTSEGVLDCVSKPDAQKIREVLNNYAEKAKFVGNNEFIESEKNKEQISIIDKSDNIRFEISFKELIVYGMMRFRPVVFIGLFVLWNYINMMPGVFESITGVKDLNNSIDSKFDNLPQHLIVGYFFSFVLIGLFFSWVIDIILTIVQYYKFTMTSIGNKLNTQYGLFSTRTATIPLNKLQYMSIDSNIVSKKFGYHKLMIQTAGLGDGKKNAEIAVPFAKFDKLVGFARKIRNFDELLDFQPVSRKTIRKSFIRYTIWQLLVISIATFFSTWSLVSLLIIIPINLFIAYYKWKNRGYQIQERFVLIKRGFFFHHISIIPIEKIQTLSISEGFFQRRLDLASIYIDTAGIGYMGESIIIDLDKYEALDIFNLINKRFKETTKN